MSAATDEISRRLDDLRARNATYCGHCLRKDVPTEPYMDDRSRICAPCKQHMERRTAARETARPLVLEYLRTRRALMRENDAQLHGEVEIDPDIGESEVSWAAQDAAKALLGFLGRTYHAQAVIDALDHHFATDYSEIHGYGQTLTFTAELDRVLLADGKDAFERFCDEHEDELNTTERTAP